MDIPLAPIVADWFRELQTLAGSSTYVLPAHSRDISEMCLNHKLSGVERIYGRHTYFEERRDALGTWAEVRLAMEAARFGTDG